MYKLIKTKPIFWPDSKKHGISLSDNCKDFINKCLDKNPKRRLGTKGSLSEVLDHPWFADIDIKKLLSKSIIPDFKPELSQTDQLDVSHFNLLMLKNET